MKVLSLLILILLYCDVRAQNNYAVNLIPSALKARAGAIIRKEEFNIEVKSLNNVEYRFKQAITILNSSADKQAQLVIWYNKTRQVKSIKGTIYDEFGIPAGRISEKNFRDESAASDYSLFEDSRIKKFRPAVTNYPYTVEYEYEIRSKQSLLFPEWTPISSDGVAVENSRMTFTCKPEFDVRYKEFNLPEKVKITTGTEGQKVYSWEIKNLKAVRYEPYSPDPETILPSVKLAPVSFEYQGVSGAFSNWNEYGKWMSDKLLEGKRLLPTPTVDHIRNLVKDLNSPREKAKKIYEYVQGKTRYVSIQIGIGGFEPFSATEVDRLGYGDCKALVNYTMALLSAAGIKSYYTIVNAGDIKKSAIPDFASMDQFNHVILCVPFEKDTVWADCTSSTLPFGYLGDFTDDRLAIVCSDTGGKLVRTPKMSTDTNKQLRKAHFTVDKNGNLSGEMSTTFGGWQYDNRGHLADEVFPEQVKKLREIYPLNNFDVQSYKLVQDKGLNPIASENIKFTSRDYALLNGNRFSIILNAVNKARLIKEISNRINEVFINRGYIDTDEIVYSLPENYKIESMPERIKIEKEFGEYQANVEVKGDNIVYTRFLRVNEGSYQPEVYEELVKFYQKVNEADLCRVTLIK